MLLNRLCVKNYQEGFQRSEFLLEHGAIDMIVKRSEMRETLANLLSKLMNMPSPFVEPELIQEKSDDV